jgi:hypothetical protein
MIPLAAWGVLDVIKGQFVSRDIQQKIPILHDLLPGWPWYIWVIVGLVLVLATALEGSYRVFAKTQVRDNEFPDITIEVGGWVGIYKYLPTRSAGFRPEPFIFFIISDMRIVNRSDQPAVIEVFLKITPEETWWAAWPATSGPLSIDLEQNWQKQRGTSLGKQLEPLINLDAEASASGYLAYYMPRDDLEIAGIENIEKALMEQGYQLEVRDHIKNTKKVFPEKDRTFKLLS